MINLNHKLSIGYNLTGQNFFNVLNKYYDYIHSWYFSPTESMRTTIYNASDEILYDLSKCDTYGLPANLLLNTFDAAYRYKETIDNVISTGIDINAITVLDPDIVPFIKFKLPNIEVHLSVRYWDWFNHDIPIDELIQYLREEKFIDVINISGSESFNDDTLIKLIHDNDMQVKIIANEGCIINRDKNYNSIPEYADRTCFENTACNMICNNITKEYPWMNLSRIKLYPEDLLFHDYDIIKLSTREFENNEIDMCIESFITYPTKYIDLMNSILKLNDDTYPIFLDYIKNRFNCSKDCFNCRKCESIFNMLNKK